MLTSVKKGKPINEEEIPPPVAIGATSNATAESGPVKEQGPPEPALMPPASSTQKPQREVAPTAPNTKPANLSPHQKLTAAGTPETPAISPLTPVQPGAQYSGKHLSPASLLGQSGGWWVFLIETTIKFNLLVCF